MLEEMTLNTKTIPIKHCVRFKNLLNRNVGDIDKAIAFSQLRNAECPRRVAINFCKKPVCRFDSTKQLDGPLKYRKLKVKKDIHSCYNGWQYKNPEYDFGNENILRRNSIEENMEKNMEINMKVNEDRIREDFKNKFKDLYRYYREMNDKFGMKNLSRQQLYKKITKWKEASTHEMKKSPRNYIDFKGVRLYDYAKHLEEKRSCKFSNSFIEKLRVYPPMGVEPKTAKSNLIMKQENKNLVLSDSEDEDATPCSPLHRNKDTNFSSFYYLRLNSPNLSPNFNPNEERELSFFRKNKKKLSIPPKKKIASSHFRNPRISFMYNTLEEESKYLKNIGDIENLIENTPNKGSLLPEKEQISINSLNIESKKFIEEEFNKSKYESIHFTPASNLLKVAPKKVIKKSAEIRFEEKTFKENMEKLFTSQIEIINQPFKKINVCSKSLEKMVEEKEKTNLEFAKRHEKRKKVEIRKKRSKESKSFFSKESHSTKSVNESLIINAKNEEMPLRIEKLLSVNEYNSNSLIIVKSNV